MNIKSLILLAESFFILVTCINARLSAQALTPEDFRIGILALHACYDSISARLGHPDSAVGQTDESAGYTAYYFPRMVVWVKNEDRTVWTLDIYDSTLATHRGVKIGDPVSLVDKLYSTEDVDIYHDRFGRVGPYDYTFHNYDEHRVYYYLPNDYEGSLLVVFSKDGIVTKILLYIGINE
jgi:hypothetical protein